MLMLCVLWIICSLLSIMVASFVFKRHFGKIMLSDLVFFSILSIGGPMALLASFVFAIILLLDNSDWDKEIF